MKARLARTKTSGQSLPLIALMIVVLVAMVGLAVDVGITYAEQRNTVRSSNAAALAGMNMLIKGGDDAIVYNTIVQSLASNRIQVAPPGQQPASGQRVLVANYLDSSGNPIASCPTVGSCGGGVPQGVTYIRVEVTGRVDTFFARVVNTNSLPVGANAWASKGACEDGVYPIAVRDQELGPNGFLNPDPPSYSDSTYRNKTKKKIYLHDPNTNPNGGFDWLRWTPQQGSANDLVPMLAGGGNIAQAFKEADWPPTNALNLPKPGGYPQYPGKINSGDWIYGNPGVSASSNVKAQLDYHMKKGSVLTLPIWDATSGSGNNAIYHVARLGTFLLLDYNLNGNANGGNNKGYFELVYLGNGGECAQLVTPPARSNNVGIIGQVFFRPRTKVVPKSRPPVQYAVILDVSGSMSWKFDGYGWRNGKAILCTGANAGCSGADAWPDANLRRIHIAKQAIKGFIDSMQPDDQMRIISFSGDLGSSGSDSQAVNKLTDAWPTSGWSSNKAELKAAADSASSLNGQPDRTEGRTPSATGINAANKAISSAQKKTLNGQDYKRVAIFLTDGVANIYRDGTRPSYSGNCGSEVASCNVGYDPGGKPRPITAMILESDTLKQAVETVYVIALAGVDETGLKSVASAPNRPFFSSSQNGTDLQDIFDSIATDVKDGNCVPSDNQGWQRSIEDAQLGDVPPPNGPLSYPVVGKAYLYNQNGGTLPNGKGLGTVQVDPQSGNLTYHFDNLTPGTYQVKAFVAFRGDDDISRIYDQIYNPNTAVIDNSLTVVVDPSTALGTVIPMKSMYLDLAGSVCPAP